jgi:hypothetical protein
MAGDSVFRCPGCGSLLTVQASIPGTWECGYCACLFPVEAAGDTPARVPALASDPGPVTLPLLAPPPPGGVARAPLPSEASHSAKVTRTTDVVLQLRSPDWGKSHRFRGA